VIAYNINYNSGSTPSEVYITTSPIIVDSEDGIDMLVIDKLKLGYRGQGTAFVELYRDTTLLWTSESLTLSNGVYNKFIETMPFDCDGTSVKLKITPTTNDFYVTYLIGIGEIEKDYKLNQIVLC
jgi:hypothetical protein